MNFGIKESGFHGPAMRFTKVQMKHLTAIFMCNFACRIKGERYQWVARWLHNGESGHTIWPQYWYREGALLLWSMIKTKLRLGYINKTQIRAYERRLAYLEEVFNLTAVDLLATEALLEG